MDVAADLAILIRNIASEIHGGQASPGVIDGRVIGYNQALGTITVVILKYHHANGNPFTLEVPYGMFMAGDTYGDYFYPEVGLFCTLAVVEGSTGETIQMSFAHDGENPPANLDGSANPSPNEASIIAPLQPGERLIICKGGGILRFATTGALQMGGPTYGGQIPAAVEGSVVTHSHTLGAFLGSAMTPASFMGALAAAIVNCTAANPLAAPALVALQTALLAAIVPPISGGTAVVPLTDTAGAVPSPAPSPPWLAPTTHAAVDQGQGAQSILLPGAGQV